MNCFNDEHSLKAAFPITVTDWGIDICFKEMHFLNAFSPIDFKFELFSNITFSNDKHFVNALLSIWVTDEGIFISFKAHPRNVWCAMILINGGNETWIRE